ncbi:3095_t:CDS:10 [Entrophospora sp. SA101]|nr:3095_t:CDS:10 [Entrophospora sp. SA101]
MTIRILNDTTIRKLRASLITCLSQCVAELVQNSLDASATSIEIHVDVTKYFIQIIDNGTGIPPDDMNNIGKRYATSKCHTLDDLKNVTTYGFRGEALANIAELSILEIISKHSNFFDTYCTIIKGGNRLQYGPTRNSKRKIPGTVVIIRDLFYSYPVRRKYKSANAMINDLESVKRTINVMALIHPNVTFTLVDSSKDAKIVTSSISIFRQLFGATLAQNLEPVYIKDHDFKVEGFISLKGFHTKIYKLVNILFNQSSFAKKNKDEQSSSSSSRLESDLELLYKSRKSHVTRSLERYCIFFIHLTCPTTYYDICYDSDKSVIEFESWTKIFNIISNLIQQFLINHGFLMKEIPTSQIENTFCCSGVNNPNDDIKMSTGGGGGYKLDLPPSFEDVAHVKSGGLRQYKFQDSELKGTTPPTFTDAVATKRNVNNPIQNIFFIKKKSGNTYKTIPIRSINRPKSSSQCTSHNSSHRHSSDKKSVSWAQEKFQKWKNPVFKSLEPHIPSMKTLAQSSSFSLLPETSKNHFSFSNSAKLNILEHRFNKHDLECSEVIGQLDDKFIVCKLPYQHAADERVRVEMFMKEFCEFKQINNIGGGNDDDDDELKISMVGTVKFTSSPIKIFLTNREAKVAWRFQKYFNIWGIFFTDKPTLSKENDDELKKATCENQNSRKSNQTSFLSTTHLHSFINPDNDCCPIFITHLPKIIFDRCTTSNFTSNNSTSTINDGNGNDGVSDSRLIQELVRQHLYWLEEIGGIGLGGFVNNYNDDNCQLHYEQKRQLKWQFMIRTCPRGILDIINSKACRGAIMFNDKLSLDQCKELIAKLSKCEFPFQCAHGRPSMIPILNLEGIQQQFHEQQQLLLNRQKQSVSSYKQNLFTNEIYNHHHLNVESSSFAINKVVENGKFGSWKKRKINLDRYHTLFN